MNDIKPFRILSYNIHRGIGTDRRYAPERILEVIKSTTADLIAIQEIYR